MEVCEFYIDENNKPQSKTLYQKFMDGRIVIHNPTKNLLDYLAIGNVMLPEDTFGLHGEEEKIDDSNRIVPEKEEHKESKPISKDNPFNMNETSQIGVNNTNNNPIDLDKTDIIDLEEISNNIVNNKNNINQVA